jgi:ATP-dependent Clp protease ATP-binding subunit ClpA
MGNDEILDINNDEPVETLDITDEKVETLDINDDKVETLDITDEENVETLDINTPITNNKSSLPDEFNMIKRYGETLTDREYITDPAIAREDELRKVMLILFTPEKSPILVGKPGVGKTAIVEGLAYRIQKNEVPEALKGYKIIKINTVAMVGNIVNEGNTDAKVQLLIEELEQLNKIILFIDETHTLVGNRENGGLDFANIFKPALSRGNLKMIGATTNAEYDFYIVKDKAFLRRLEKIDIDEPNAEMTVKILLGTIPKLEKTMGVKFNYTDFVKETVMKFIVELTTEYNRIFESASRYPDVCLNIITKIFSYAIIDNTREVKFKHIWQGIKTTETVYPDVKKKYTEIFKQRFSKIIEEENVII